MPHNKRKRSRGRNKNANRSLQNNLQTACDTAAQNALDNAAQAGFSLLNNGDPLTQQPPSNPTADQLKTDLAARQIEHALEAWHYLSQSAMALLNNHEEIAIHLAYYAEVRAANSLLAATGINNKERPSYYIDSRDNLRKLDVRTHELIRLIWGKWHIRSDTKHAFTSLQIAPSVTLEDIGVALGIQNIQSNPLQQWSFELVHFTGDHKARNMASYNVTKTYSGIPPIQFGKNANLLKLIWEHMRPAVRTGQCHFEIEYARYLLWGQCHNHALRPDNSIDNNIFLRKLSEYIQLICRNTGAPEETLSRILNISPERPENFVLFDLAAEQQTNPENIIARAAVLCRLATNKLNFNIQLNQCSQAVAWIKKWLEEVGILNPGDDPSDLADNFEDYYDAAEEISQLDIYNAWQISALSAHKCSRLDHTMCWALEYEPS